MLCCVVLCCVVLCYVVLCCVMRQTKQALWPQCQTCFQMQGSAVRVNEHRLVYSSGLKAHHFALFLAGVMAENVVETETYAELAESAEGVSRHVRRLLAELGS
jgi:hypothetical protein